MQGKPKIATWVKLSGLPSSISMGDMRFGLDLQGLRFKTYAAYYTASPQKSMGRRQLKIMQCAIFSITLCMCPASPFDAGLSASVRWRAIPLRSQNRSMFVYSPPPSVRNTRTRQSKRRSKWQRNSRISARPHLWSWQGRCGNNSFCGQRSSQGPVLLMVNWCDGLLQIGTNDFAGPVNWWVLAAILVRLSALRLFAFGTSHAIWS